MEVRVGGPIRTFSDVSEVSEDCNLTFEHSFPGVVLYSNWEQRALCSWETGFVVLEATVLCVGKRPDAAVSFGNVRWHLRILLQEYS